MSARAHILPVFVPHLGCPHRCVFCNQHDISGAEKPADAETVEQALAGAHALFNSGMTPQLAFYGGSFTAIPQEQQMELLKAASDFAAAGGTIRLSTRPDAITSENLAFLKSMGVSIIELGCQSMDAEVLRLSERGHTAADVIVASEKIKSAGFQLILQMMTGLPGDTLEKALYTAETLADIHPDGVRIYPTVIVRDTPLYQMWKAGQYREHTVEEAVEWCSQLVPVFESRRIPIIRLGLNPSDELTGGEAAGGAYHPAFGELVHARMFLNQERKLLKTVNSAETAVFLVNPSDLSAAVGQRKSNRLKLAEEFPKLRVIFKPCADLARGEIKVEKNTGVCYK